jgi:uncharacterized membrane protein YdjX (TVP38/TMEM64 family)
MKEVTQWLTEIIADLGALSLGLAVIALFALYALKSAVMFIHIVTLYIAAGLLLPLPWAIAATYAGLALNFSISYAIGRKLGYGKVEALLSKTPRVADFVERKRQSSNRSLSVLCFTMRLIPFPLELVSMLFGAVQQPFGKYLFASLLGKSATMIPFVIAGGAITNPLSAEFLVPLGVSIGITLAIFATSIILQKRKQKKLNEDS